MCTVCAVGAALRALLLFPTAVRGRCRAPSPLATLAALERESQVGQVGLGPIPAAGALPTRRTPISRSGRARREPSAWPITGAGNNTATARRNDDAALGVESALRTHTPKKRASTYAALAWVQDRGVELAGFLFPQVSSG